MKQIWGAFGLINGRYRRVFSQVVVDAEYRKKLLHLARQVV